MNRFNFLKTLIAGMVLSMLASQAEAIVMVNTETVPTVGGNTSTDAGLSFSVSSGDLLDGLSLSSNLPELGSLPFSRVTDGLAGQQDFGPDGRTIVSNISTPWEVTYSGLGGVNIGELRLFSWNTNGRSVQNYTVEASSDGGSNFATLANVSIPNSNASNVSQLIDSNPGTAFATGVTDLKFTFQPNGTQHISLIEIDAFTGVAPPPPAVPTIDAVLKTVDATVGNRDNFTGTVGFGFTLDADSKINALGYQDAGGDGLVLDHQVGLWRLSDGALLASVVVPAGSTALLDDDWRYVEIGSEIALVTGETYVVGAEVFSNSGDGWTDVNGDAADFMLAAGLLDVNPTNLFFRNAFGPIPNSDGGATDLRWAPGNAAFISTPSVVPEPTTGLLLVAGLSAIVSRRRRSLS